MISLSCLRKVPCQLILIISIGLFAFSPALFSELCVVDDQQMVDSLKNQHNFSLPHVFIPDTGGGLYYRPLLVLSFYADRFIFGLSSFSMHLHNLVLHIVNALLLFFIAIRMQHLEKHEYPYVPLIAALLFLVHPITTESVNWVSGRTDILASTSILSSTYLLLKYLESRSRWYVYSALFFFVCAVLSKEFSIAFLPGFILLVLYQRSCKSRIINLLMISVLSLSVPGVFFLLRSLAFSSNATSISTSLLVIFNTPERALQLALTAIGFYTKKLFVPMPLNFAIYEVNALYEFVAWPVLTLVAYLLWKRTLTAIMFVTGVLLISPAILIVFNQIAWTPFAERYLYLPAAFVVLATTNYLRRHLLFPNSATRGAAVLLILVFFCWFTVQRNILWMTSYGIVEDTVRKSPESVDMQYELSSVLISKKEFSRARSIIGKINIPSVFSYDERGDFLEIDILLREGKRDQAIQRLEQTVEKSKFKSAKSVNALIDFYKETMEKTTGDRLLAIRKKIYDVRKKHYQATHNVALLLDLHKDALNIGDTKRAELYLELSRQNNSSQKK